MCALALEDPPSLLLEAMARKPRAKPRSKPTTHGEGEGGYKIPQNNFIAEAAPKQRAGAPKGNRNALKTGLSTAEFLAFKARMRLVYGAARQALE